MAVVASKNVSPNGNNEGNVEPNGNAVTEDADKLEDSDSSVLADAGSRFAAVVRVAVKVKHWITGRADVDNRRERLQTDFVMLGFFNSMYTANNNLLATVSPDASQNLTNRDKFLQFFNRIKGAFTTSIDDTASPFYYWSLIVTIACFYNFISIPLTIYAEFQENYFIHWLVGGWITDCINFIDLWFQARREFLDDGVRHTNWKQTMKHYADTVVIYFDLIALWPTDLALLIYPLWGFCRLNRLLKIHRISDFLERTEIRTNFPNMFRLFRLVSICFVLFHWNGCFYFLVSIAYDYQNASIDDWAFSFDKIFDALYPDCDARFISENCSVIETFDEWANREDRIMILDAFFFNRTKSTHAATLVKKYMLSFYWSALTLTTLGEQPWPNDSFETLFETVDTLIGLIIFAVIVGDVGAMVTAMNLTRTNFEERLDGCKRFMKFRQVNPELKTKIVAWFEYVWKEGTAKIDETQIACSLPSRLRGQLAVHIHMETLRKVTLFHDCEPGLLYELVLKLQYQVFSPNDYVCRKGDIGKELYIIKKGKLQVVSEDGKTVFVTLAEGSVFGELSVLNIKGNKNGNRRTASIRSVGYSDLYTLTKKDLWEVLREYPEAKQLLITKGKEILKRDNLMEENYESGDDDDLDDEDEGATVEQRLEKIARVVFKSQDELEVLDTEFGKSIAEHKQKLVKLERRYVKKQRSMISVMLNKHTKKYN